MFRPRIQFRLATFLIVVTLVATLLVRHIRRRAAERVAAARMAALQSYGEELSDRYQKTSALLAARAKGGELRQFYFDGAERFSAMADSEFERGHRVVGIAMLEKSFRCACDCLDAMAANPPPKYERTPNVPKVAAIQRDVGLRLIDEDPDAVPAILAEWQAKRRIGPLRIVRDRGNAVDNGGVSIVVEQITANDLSGTVAELNAEITAAAASTPQPVLPAAPLPR